MIFDGLSQTSTPAEGRKNSFSDLNKHKNFRRRNMQIRRFRSVSDEKSDDVLILADPIVSSKKMRSDVQNEIRLIEDAIGVQLPEKVAGEVASLSHGNISVIGRRREMEDAVAVELNFLKKGGKSYDFFGVYDGHGGWRVAQACSEMLHKVLVEIVDEHTIGEEIAWGSLMAAGFRKMDEEVIKNGADATTGSTAVVAVVGEEVVVVANCGDSRAVVCRGGVAVQLSDDHKPDRPDELERIEASGGKVINWNGNRVLGVLATSRSIGDEYLKPFVITDPEIKVINRTEWDEFLVLGSDGLWDVISNDIACNIVKRCLDGPMRRSWKKGNDECSKSSECRAAKAAILLAELAMARGSNDNISVVVVDLKISSRCRSSGLAC